MSTTTRLSELCASGGHPSPATRAHMHGLRCAALLLVRGLCACSTPEMADALEPSGRAPSGEVAAPATSAAPAHDGSIAQQLPTSSQKPAAAPSDTPAMPGQASAGAGGATAAATSTSTETSTGSTETSTGSTEAAAGAASPATADNGGAAGGDASAAGAASPAAMAATSVLPPIDDPAMPGPFGCEQVATAPGLSTHTLFVPQKLGDQGTKHPILVWMNGATGTTSFYQNLLEHFATHGFFVVADKMSGSTHDPEIAEQKVAIDWVLAEAQRAESPYFGKIDPERLGIAGHSLGSVGSFANTDHPAVKASIHWSGGLTGNPVGADEAWLQRIHSPAAFLCGGAEARALPRCSGDFDNAPAGVPIFYGTVAGVGHTDVFGEPNGGQWGRAAIAWWRLMLAGDESFRSWFSAPDCVLCQDPWTSQSRDI